MAKPKSAKLLDSNDASYQLCMAISLLDLLVERYEQKPVELANIFGGSMHVDLNTIFCIRDQVVLAKRIIDDEEVVRG